MKIDNAYFCVRYSFVVPSFITEIVVFQIGMFLERHIPTQQKQKSVTCANRKQTSIYIFKVKMSNWIFEMKVFTEMPKTNDYSSF